MYELGYTDRQCPHTDRLGPHEGTQQPAQSCTPPNIAVTLQETLKERGEIKCNVDVKRRVSEACGGLECEREFSLIPNSNTYFTELLI